MPPSSKPNVPICGASLSASADCGVGIICSLDCPAHAARMEVDRISVIILVTAGLDRTNSGLNCLKRSKHKVNLLICSTRAEITDEQTRSDENTPELQSLMSISYYVFFLYTKTHTTC